MRALLVKSVLVFVVSFTTFFFLNTGFYEEPLWQVLQALFFSAIVVLFYLKKIRKVWILYLFFVLFLGMVISLLFENVFVAEILGSTGFGLIIILLISYLPNLIKDGYLKKW